MKFLNSFFSRNTEFRNINITIKNNEVIIDNNTIYNIIAGIIISPIKKNLKITLLDSSNNFNFKINFFFQGSLILNIDIVNFLQLLELFNYNIFINNIYYKKFLYRNMQKNNKNIFYDIIYHYYLFIFSNFTVKYYFNYFWQKYKEKDIDIIFLTNKILLNIEELINSLIEILSYFNDIFIKNYLVLNFSYLTQEEIITKFLNINFFFLKKEIKNKQKNIINKIDKELNFNN